jgi:protein involved in polysaccharide export with SLBB domain
VAVLGLGAAAALEGQNPPPRTTPPAVQQQLPPGMTPEQAAQLLRQRPELGSLVRQRLQQSGLSPDQIRARLRAAGYPSNLLDAYLGADTLGAAPPSPSGTMVEAISILGLATFTAQDSLLLRGDTLALRLYQDSLRADSIFREDSLAQVRRRLTLFGLDVFRQPSTRFVPLVTGPVDDRYVLGPGDVLVLILTGAVEDAQQFEVTREGFVVIPRVGQIYVNNLSLGQLREVLYQRLSRVYSGITRQPDAKTKFEITVANVRVLTLRVVGEVGRPGSYQIPATGSVLTAIYQAGGLTERAGFREVQVRRGAELLGTVDLYDYLLGGVVPSGLQLASGDVIFVPVRGARVKIAGEVNRPAIYEIKRGETLRDLVRLAGGLTPLASTEAATIDRILPPELRPAPGLERTVLTVNLKEALDPKAPPVTLAAGDSVTVFAVKSPRRNVVTITGNVWQPGTYSLRPGMRLWDLIALAGGLRPETYEDRVQIVRTYPDSTRQLVAASLTGGPDGNQVNPVLREWDEVTVYSRAEFTPERYVAVFGAVRKQGIVPFADSMTLRDAILLAGGLRNDAYLMEAEVSRVRRGAGDGGDTLALLLRIPLDSSYLTAPDPYGARPVGTARSGDFVLHPYDNVFVRRQPGWETQRNVVLTGEVRFPGRYTLLRKDERLLEVLQRAGGLTPQAYANGIRFFRAEGGAGRIAVDLPRVLRQPNYKDNLVLAAGDSIHIPAYIPTVRVEGAVNSPGSVPYVKNAGLTYYVAAAGGFSRRADKRGIFVQQPNGLVQKWKSPEPGAVVVVPQKDPTERGVDFVALFSSIAQILAATTTVIVVLTR